MMVEILQFAMLAGDVDDNDLFYDLL